MSPSMSMPRPTDAAKEAFATLVPQRPGVTMKPMFGNLSAFVNGNMFAGLFGDDLFVRVGDSDRKALLAKGGRDFEPMPGRAMKGYVVLPPGWRTDTGQAQRWLATALTGIAKMPAKNAGGAKSATAAKGTATAKSRRA